MADVLFPNSGAAVEGQKHRHICHKRLPVRSVIVCRSLRATVSIHRIIPSAELSSFPISYKRVVPDFGTCMCNLVAHGLTSASAVESDFGWRAVLLPTNPAT